MSTVPLQDRFPDLEPINSAPSLHTINGVGTTLFGSRDHDAETGTYVTTLCACFAFIPIMCLAAYRVAAAGGNRYYFLGKTRLSPLAKAWNALVIAALIVGIPAGMYSVWYYLPENVAKRQLAAADQLAAAGNYAEAAYEYQSLAVGKSAQQNVAISRLQDWLKSPPGNATTQAKHTVWQAAVALDQMGRWNQEQLPLHVLAMEFAEECAEKDPKLAIKLIDEAEPLMVDPKIAAPRKRKVLEQIHERLPSDLEVTSQLALALEQEDQMEKCEVLLVPQIDKLADTEGARILGQHYVNQGKYDEAYSLLSDYCQSRLPHYREAEKAFTDAIKAAQQAAFDELKKKGKGDPLYERYQRASEQEQEEIVDEFIGSALKHDPLVARRRGELRRQSRVVPVALDFGVVQLHRAQAIADAQLRKAELQLAEETFLAIGNAVGDSDEFKLNMGKVNYWLGKHDEGKKLLDDILQRNAGDFRVKYAVARTLREVGAERESRELIEKLYNEEKNEDNKFLAAEYRSLLRKDLDDEILWLSRARPGNPSVKASLCLARGNKALMDGDESAAERELRQAAELYVSFPENAGSLNDAALCYNGLFHLLGKVEDISQAARLLEKAVALKPDDSTLMINAASQQLDLAMAQVTAGKIDPRVVRLGGRYSAPALLYRDSDSRQQMLKEFKQTPAVTKSMQYFERSILLAPKRRTNYAEAEDLYDMLDDVAAQERLLRQIREAQPDTRETIEDLLKSISGKDDEKNSKLFAGHETKLRRLVDHWRAAGPSAERQASLAAALTITANALIGKSALKNQQSSPDDVVRVAEEAVQVHGSSMADRTLVSAYLFRAHTQLAKSNRDYQRLADPLRRLLPPYSILALGLEEKSIRPAILAHADFKRAVPLIQQNIERFPKTGSAEYWMLMRYIDPSASEAAAQRVRDDQSSALDSQIGLLLNPASPYQALSESWRLRCEGKEAEAKAPLQKLAEYGVKWPQK
jgi:tetratricopeptide (TPR) repeat protein